MTTRSLSRILAAGALAAAACTGAVRDTTPAPAPTGTGAPSTPAASGVTSATPGAAPGAVPFEPLPAHVAAEKVKTLLTGLALTDDELATVLADPQGLRRLVDRWMATPEWRAKMMELFKYAFQQTQTSFDDYITTFITNLVFAPETRPLVVRAAEEMFARTAMAIVDEGRPFTEVVTTERFVMNSPLMALYAFQDTNPLGDDGRAAGQSWFLKKYPTFAYEITSNGGVPIPFEQSIDPASPSYMRFQAALPMPSAANARNCPDPEITRGTQGLRDLLYFLFGGRQQCGYALTPQWTAADWQAWRMVTLRAPRAGEEPTRFWDLPRLRDPKTAELVVATPRVGFMSTLAFFANWPTNDSNSYRVTTNQALIVALGRSFDDRGTTVQVAETSDDALHVTPGTACYGCHQTLDPMRDFFRQSFSLTYYTQYATRGIPAQGTFTVDGSAPVTGAGVGALARAIAAHPRFALAWAQRLCAFATSAPCLDEDPELQRVAAAFRASRFDFKTLVRELFTSPLVTFAARTVTADKLGVVMSIARREVFCAALEHRLGIPDLCGTRGDAAWGTRVLRARAQSLALAIPGEGYARGDEHPLLPHDPSLLFHAASENLCALLAAQAVDASSGRFASARPDDAIRALVATVASLPDRDPRAAGMRAILKDHHTEALAGGIPAREAMQSTFMLACQSPTSIALGL